MVHPCVSIHNRGDAALVVGVRTPEPPHFFSLNPEKMGIPRLPLTTHLPYSPCWPQLWDCTKNGQPCRRSSKSFKQKGKN